MPAAEGNHAQMARSSGQRQGASCSYSVLSKELFITRELSLAAPFVNQVKFLLLVHPCCRCVFVLNQVVESLAVQLQQLPLYRALFRIKGDDLQVVEGDNLAQLPQKFVTSIFAIVARCDKSPRPQKSLVARRHIRRDNSCHRCHEELALVSKVIPALSKDTQLQCRHYRI